MADPSLALIKHVADWILDLIPARNAVDYREFIFRIPVCGSYILEDFSGRASGNRYPSQHTSFNLHVGPVDPVHRHRQLAGARDGKQLRVADVEPLA